MRTRWATLVAVAVLASAMIAPGTASASTTEAIADTGGMTLLTLGVGGSPLDITVTLDEIGHITEVAVGDADRISGEGDHRVRFSHEDDGTRISVQAKNHKLAADVKAADLADVVGTHEWRAPLFGSTEDTVVSFEVVDNGGYPELVVHKVLSAAEFVVGEVDNETEEGEAESSVKIVFTQDGSTMTLKIQVSMDSDDDDEDSSVKLRIVLRGKDVQNRRGEAIDDLMGKHTWDGHLCDGSVVAITYNISDSGDVTVVEGTGEYEIKDMPHGFVAEFDGSKVKLTIELKETQDGEWDLKVRSKSTDKCNPSDDRDRGNDGDADDDDESEQPGRRDKDKKNKDDDEDEEDDD